MHHHPDFKTCLDIIHALDDYLSRELAPDETETIEKHLHLCEECMVHYHFEKALILGIRKKALECRAPSGLRQRVLRMLDNS